MKNEKIGISKCKWFSTIMFTIFLGLLGIQNLYSRKIKKYVILNILIPIISILIIGISSCFIYTGYYNEVNVTAVVFVVIGSLILLTLLISTLVDTINLLRNNFYDRYGNLIDMNKF